MTDVWYNNKFDWIALTIRLEQGYLISLDGYRYPGKIVSNEDLCLQGWVLIGSF